MFFCLLSRGAQKSDEISFFSFTCRERTLCPTCCFVLAFWVDSRIHAHTRVVLKYVVLARSSPSSSSKFTVRTKSFFVVFASWLGSLLGGVTRLFRHFLGSVSHSGSLYHSKFSALDANPSRLARCAGLSSVGTCCEITRSLVFSNRLTTNCL